MTTTETNEGYIYVLHGRRGKVPESNLKLLGNYSAASGKPSVIAFLEGDQQTLEDGIRTLQQQVRHIVVVPVLLFSATHVRWDTPERIGKVLDPDVAVTYVPPLGTTNAVRKYLSTQLADAVRKHPSHTILLVAHGTGHFPDPWEELQRLSDELEPVVGAPIVCANHIGGHLYQDVAPEISAPLIVQRLFLTEGRLANRIRDRVLAVKPDSVILPTLEDHEVITQAIDERLAQVGLK